LQEQSASAEMATHTATMVAFNDVARSHQGRNPTRRL